MNLITRETNCGFYVYADGDQGIGAPIGGGPTEERAIEDLAEQYGIKVERLPTGEWEAWREDDVDPEGYPRGSGDTKREAIEELFEELTAEALR